jgi:hypothetical protein
MRLAQLPFLCPLLAGCPIGGPGYEDPCVSDPDTTLTDTDVLPVWETSIAEHPLLANSPFVGTLTYDADGSTTVATLTTAYRDVVIQAWRDPNPDPVACEPTVEFTMDITLLTADGAFDETLVADIYDVWIDEGTLSPAAVNDAVQGTYPTRYTGDATALTGTRLDLTHAPTEPLPSEAELTVFVEGVDYDLDIVGSITFE